MNKKSKVILLPCNSYREEIVYENLEIGLELLGGIENIVGKEESVLLKPNLLKKAEVDLSLIHIQMCIRDSQYRITRGEEIRIFADPYAFPGQITEAEEKAFCAGVFYHAQMCIRDRVTRDLIADSTEAMAMAHQFDALVMVPNCDKNVPGLLMAAARINVPTVFVSGGPMMAGHIHGHKTSLSSMFEAVGSYAAGKISEEELTEFENKTCPTCGSCSGMYTCLLYTSKTNK